MNGEGGTAENAGARGGDAKPRPSNCRICGMLLGPEEEIFACAICGNDFCQRCPGNHIPPRPVSIEVRLKYEYKLKGRMNWQPASTKLQWRLKNPVCSNCFDIEEERGIEQLRTIVKSWKHDQLKDMNLKIVKEDYPESTLGNKLKLVESAKDFLRTISEDEAERKSLEEEESQ